MIKKANSVFMLQEQHGTSSPLLCPHLPFIRLLVSYSSISLFLAVHNNLAGVIGLSLEELWQSPK